ncbi:sterol desaturase family protein [Pseudochryseolinea flava]|nr:sterol desaturase family protein [Pseudochryseolinea flava]
MPNVLHDLDQLSTTQLWILFLVENLLITLSVLVIGGWIMKSHQKPRTRPTRKDWVICGVTNVINTVVTYLGFYLCQTGYIAIDTQLSWYILLDFMILFFAMDLLMYVFHYLIHKSFLYEVVHGLHHQSVNPKPIDLFVLHPVETFAFGTLWLVLLMTNSFSLIAIMIYLTVNVAFGLLGHLEIEPLPELWRQKRIFRYIGTATFHHRHHQDVTANFGFYTSLWDKLFGTFGKS